MLGVQLLHRSELVCAGADERRCDIEGTRKAGGGRGGLKKTPPLSSSSFSPGTTPKLLLLKFHLHCHCPNTQTQHRCNRPGSADTHVSGVFALAPRPSLERFSTPERDSFAFVPLLFLSSLSSLVYPCMSLARMIFLKMVLLLRPIGPELLLSRPREGGRKRNFSVSRDSVTVQHQQQRVHVICTEAEPALVA